MSERSITIATVNWFSAEYLEKLFGNLISKAQMPEKLHFLIVDNANGRDANLQEIKTQFANVEIINNDPGNLKGSPAHACGLNVIMQNIKTPYALILDPDVHVFKKHWDAFLMDLLEHNNILAAGTTYPVWQMGMYHNFPNPVFCFFKTDEYRRFCPGWSAYDVNNLTLCWDFVRRNLLRFGILIGRRRFEDSRLVRTAWPRIEKFFGVCSRDTGWRIAQKAKREKIKSIIFQTRIVASKNFDPSDPFAVLARHFELYCWQNGEPLLTHKYSTNSSVFKTVSSNNSDLWLQCIRQIEEKSG